MRDNDRLSLKHLPIMYPQDATKPKKSSVQSSSADMNPLRETETSPYGWTLQTLFVHFNSLLVAQKEAIFLAQSAAAAAMIKAENATEKRFEGVNEFRLTLSDQQRAFIPRLEVENLYAAMNDRVTKLELRNQELNARQSGIGVGWAYVVAGLGFLGGAIGVVSFVISIIKLKAG
jgi:hypothetical protein